MTRATAQSSLSLLLLGLLLLLLQLVGCGSSSASRGIWIDEARSEWVDLTYSFSDETIYWPTAEPFRLEQVSYGHTPAGYFYAANNFSAAEHGGTHTDAPIHFAEGHSTIDAIGLERLIGPAAVIDVSASADRDPDYLISPADVTAWEAQYGPLPEGAIVLLRTGFGARYPDRAAYLGTDRTGPEAVPDLHFPGLSPETAAWLIANRTVAAVGIDTPSIDRGQSSRFETHVTLFEAEIPAFENVARLDRLPATGAYVIALPMKIEGGSGGPTRIIALVPR